MNHWNKLARDVVVSSSLKVFKTKLGVSFSKICYGSDRKFWSRCRISTWGSPTWVTQEVRLDDRRAFLRGHTQATSEPFPLSKVFWGSSKSLWVAQACQLFPSQPLCNKNQLLPRHRSFLPGCSLFLWPALLFKLPPAPVGFAVCLFGRDWAQQCLLAFSWSGWRRAPSQVPSTFI